MRHNESLKPHGLVYKKGKTSIESFSADNGVLNGIHQTWSDDKFTAAFYIKGELKGSIQWDDDEKEVQREGDPNMIEKEDFLEVKERSNNYRARGGGFARGALRGERGSRGGFDDGERNFGRGGYHDRGGYYMHRGGYNDRRDGLDDSRGRGGMPPPRYYGGRGGGRGGMDGGRRGFGTDDCGSVRGGRPAQDVINTKSRGGAGASSDEGGDD